MLLKSLRIFCDVVDCRSFSRAADRNGLTQSGTSQIVHQLEERLSVKLLDRSTRPFLLTAEGELYYSGCRDLVNRFDSLEDEVRRLHEEVVGRVRVASIYSVGLSHMNVLVQQFMERHPKANIRVNYQHPSSVLRLIDDDRADLGLVSFPTSTRSLEAVGWRKEPMVVVCAPNHKFAERSSVRLSELAGMSMVGFDEELTIRQKTDRLLAKHHVNVQISMAFDNIETIKRAIEINAGIGLLPQPTTIREVAMGTLVEIPLADVEFVRPIGIVHRRGKELSTTVRRFMDLLQHPPDSTSSLQSSDSPHRTEEVATPPSGPPSAAATNGSRSKATTPEATTPEATTPEATTPEETTPEETGTVGNNEAASENAGTRNSVTKSK